MRLKENLKLIVSKENNEKVILVNEMGEELGNINRITKELIELLENDYDEDSICKFFSNKYEYPYKYVEENVEKIVSYLYANDILVNGASNEK